MVASRKGPANSGIRSGWLIGVILAKLESNNCKTCKIMQSATLCKVQAYAKCKIMQSANVCKVQIYAKCKFMQSTKLGMVQNYAKFETSKHVKYFKSATTSRKISQFRVCLMLISYGSPHDKVTLFFVSIFVCFCL